MSSLEICIEMTSEFSNTCRLCLGQEFLTSIFQKRGSVQIATKVKILTNINISPSDGLPNKICSDCIKKLDDCTEFINLCQCSEKKLRTLYKNSDEDSQSGLDINFENENYSLGIEEEHLTTNERNLITEDDPDHQVFSITEDTAETRIKDNNLEQEEDRKEEIGSKEDELGFDDKKKIEKQCFQCFTCGKVMSSKFRLTTHLMTHSGERPFSCPHCDKSFTLEQNLKVHMRIHTGEKPFECSVCGESFKHTAGLSAHKLKHTGQTPYHCVLCPRSFRTNGHLKYHVRRHKGEMKFKCDTCKKAFITRSTLKQHLLIHTGDKPYVCAVCGKRMTRAAHVKQHMQHAHSKPLVCNECPVKFKQKPAFERHKETHEIEKKWFSPKQN